jgi:hypothetical protein
MNDEVKTIAFQFIVHRFYFIVSFVPPSSFSFRPLVSRKGAPPAAPSRRNSRFCVRKCGERRLLRGSRLTQILLS